MNNSHQRGFSLVELSIVILVLGLLLGGLMMPLAMQKENAKLRDSRHQIESALKSIEGFALANGFVPCPATPDSDGIAAANAGGCVAQHGFLPATTLNLNGSRNDDSLLLDPWGSPLRYSVSASDANTNGSWDFVTAGEMQNVGMSALQPDLAVCSTAAASTATQCGSAADTLTASAPLLVYSLGNDWSVFTSVDQIENVGANLGGGPSGGNYRVAADAVFVMKSISALGGSEFDDIVIWMSPNELYTRLVDAGYLP